MSAEALPGAAAEPARFLSGHHRALLSRIEDAGLNASAPPQQRWFDGWLVRLNPGKAQRARCVNAVSAGLRPVREKLGECEPLYRQLGLPMVVRITPFTVPDTLDGELAALGYAHHDPTRVMVLPTLGAAARQDRPQPAGTTWVAMAAREFAEAVGALRGASPQECAAHAERLLASPVPYRGYALRGSTGAVLACGQVAIEGSLAGLYDVATAASQQRQGFGAWLCKRLLTLAADEAGCTAAYLQVGADNLAARRIYMRMGFEDGYSYHYRLARLAPRP